MEREFNLYEEWAADMNRDGVIDNTDVDIMVDLIQGKRIPDQASTVHKTVSDILDPTLRVVLQSSNKDDELSNAASTQFVDIVLETQIPLRPVHMELVCAASDSVVEVDQLIDSGIVSRVRQDTVVLILYNADGSVIEPGSVMMATVAVGSPLAEIKGSTILAVPPLKFSAGIAVDPAGNKLVIDSKDDHPTVPKSFSLSTYPNPFNPSTKFIFDLPASATVSVTIYNLLGREVWSTTRYIMQSGSHMIVWDGENSIGIPVSSGFYLATFVAKSEEMSYHQTRKMVLLR
ncbi:MAG: FlgD immunoglobulin-like domain containing protein [Fidelibacterota bacterium]